MICQAPLASGYTMRMSIFGDWLDRVLKARDIKQAALGREVGVTQGAVSRWISGSEIRPDHAREVARALNFPVQFVLDMAGYGPEPWDGPAPAVDAPRQVAEDPVLYAVPLSGAIHAGRETLVPPEEELHWAARRVYKLPGNQTAKWVIGDCMDGQDPDIKAGEVVFIDPDLPWKVGDVLALQVEGGVQVMKLSETNGHLSFITRHGPVVVEEEDARILGVVVSAQRTFRR